MFRDQTAETKEWVDDKEPCQHGRWISGRCECLIEHCSLMDLAQEEVYTFVFGPLNVEEAYLSPFTGDCKDTNGYCAGEKSMRGNLSVGNSYLPHSIVIKL